MKIVVIGGGAAGFFAAINCALNHPHTSVILLEKAKALLAKVRISGGGRCNVTHSCFDPKILITHYPRGGKALLGPFHKFQPKDTIEWFETRGVELKTENDGRMFPVTNSSETIIQCFLAQAEKARVNISPESAAINILKTTSGFEITLQTGEILLCDKLLIATGSNNKMYGFLEALGHTIIPPVPSLFTFTINDERIHKLSGVSHPLVGLKIKNTSLEQTGPLLLTHWGFSGPAILKLSAWGARVLFEKNYQVELVVNWTISFKEQEVKEALLHCKNAQQKRCISQDPLFHISKNLWKMLVQKSGIPDTANWGVLSNKQQQDLIEVLRRDTYSVLGKSTNKDEFVTAGGVALDEVDFKTMESKVCKGLYFAGEVLDIDGVTGGFNFQNAWTTAWIAAENLY